MNIGKITKDYLIKMGPITKVVDEETLKKIAKDANSDRMSSFSDINLFNLNDQIEEGVVYANSKIQSLIYKISPKKISQKAFANIATEISKEFKDIIDLIWDKKYYNYYIPELYFIEMGAKSSNSDYYLVYPKNTFIPILNLFRPDYQEYTSTYRNNTIITFKNIPNYNDFFISPMCLGGALGGMPIYTYKKDKEDLYSKMFNSILSAQSNADLRPEEVVSLWHGENGRYCSELYDIVLRLISNLSQKMSKEDFLELSKEAQFDTRVFLNKVLELNDYTKDEEEKISELFYKLF